MGVSHLIFSYLGFCSYYKIFLTLFIKKAIVVILGELSYFFSLSLKNLVLGKVLCCLLKNQSIPRNSLTLCTKDIYIFLIIVLA